MQRQAVKRNIQVIQPIRRAELVQASLAPKLKKRVAAYARVSTDNEEQLTSYEAQVDYYTRKINARTDWEFVEVYTDKGISGTNTKRREGFKLMVQDALDGKIDLILTKSVSRFARNTVDTLTTIRQLKERGVAVYFEEQSIDTMDGKGELLITIMSSIAQEESRSISDNVTWGQRKRFADGKVSVGYRHFLGFERGEDGLPQVVEEEAETVRFIYRLFMEGKTPGTIAQRLTEMGIPTPGQKQIWQSSTVLSILQNEKYKGAAILQKRFTIDFMQKKTKVNEGEVPQYYIENSHEAIIDPLEHERVQLELKRRQKDYGRYSSKGIFSSRIICADCGYHYGPKVWHSTSAYKRTIWQCNHKYQKGKPVCTTPHFTEDELKRTFLDAFEQLLDMRDAVLAACDAAIETVCSLSEIDSQISGIEDEIAVLVDMSKKLIEENSRHAQNQEEYKKKHSALVERYDTADAKLKALQTEREERIEKKKELEWFMDCLKEQSDIITEFDESLFCTVTQKMTIFPDNHIEVTFRDGTVISC
nr:MAG TPA: integrase [Caudoviricetes sp.]